MPIRESRPKLRGTQLLVEHMSTVTRRPVLVAIEIAWRWLFGIPFLLVCLQQARQILAAYRLESSGFNLIDPQNPWASATQLAHVIAFYEPHVAAVARWLLPSAALAWIIISGVGRALVLHFLEPDRAPRLPFKPLTVIATQTVWLCLLALVVWAWLHTMHWVWFSHSSAGGEPDLIGYSIWAIFLVLGFFTAWALISWTVSIAPLLALYERRSTLSALGASIHLGREFSGKLAEINLVLGIVKLALLVVAMVFSAAPLPFSDELGPDAMHFVWAGAAVFFLVADDCFQVVRLKAFAEFRKVYRGAQEPA